jgi:Leucine rich repeat
VGTIVGKELKRKRFYTHKHNTEKKASITIQTTTMTSASTDTLEETATKLSQLPIAQSHAKEQKKQFTLKHRCIVLSLVFAMVVIVAVLCSVLLISPNEVPSPSPPNSTAANTTVPRNHGTTDKSAIILKYSSPLGTACFFLGFTNMSDCLSTTSYGEKQTGSGLTVQLKAIPTEIGLLTHLKVLSLDRNAGLVGTIPTEIGLLTQLVTLTLHGTGLSGTIPSAVGQLTLLKKLFLGSNNFSGPIPTAMASLSNLREVYIDDNGLTGSIPSTIFEHWTKVTTLFMNNNKLTGSIPASVTKMSLLQTLFLSDNQLTGSIPGMIGSLLDLSRFWIGNNVNMNGIIPSIQKTKLYDLQITNTSITGKISALLCSRFQDVAVYQIDCDADAEAGGGTTAPKIYCNCCVSDHGKRCANSTFIPTN